MPRQNVNIGVNVPNDKLTQTGFTESGAARYKETIKDFANEIFKNSIKLADMHKGKNLPREVTHENVRDATIKFHPKEPKPTWIKITLPLEYLSALIAGLGVGNIDQHWGQYTFTVSIIIGVSLMIIRLTKGD